MDMGWGRMEAVIAAESCLTSIPPCGWAGPVWTRVFSRLISLTHRGTTLHYTCCHTHTSPTQSTRNSGSMQKQGCSFAQCSSERVISRLNLVKIWFSQNTFLIFFFTARAFIMVKCILKLVLEFKFHLENPRKQPKKLIFEKWKITVIL